MTGNAHPSSTTLCKTDTEYTNSNFPAHASPEHPEPIESDTAQAISDEPSEIDHHKGEDHDNYQYDEVEPVAHYVEDDENDVQNHHQHHHQPKGVQQRESMATTTNSFDQVADEIADDLEVFEHVEEHELQNLAELIPERNQDRLFSEADPAPEPSTSIARSESQNIDEEQIAQMQEEGIVEKTRHQYEHHEHHEYQEHHEHVHDDETEVLDEHTEQDRTDNEDTEERSRHFVHHHHHHVEDDEPCGCVGSTTAGGETTDGRTCGCDETTTVRTCGCNGNPKAPVDTTDGKSCGCGVTTTAAGETIDRRSCGCNGTATFPEAADSTNDAPAPPPDHHIPYVQSGTTQEEKEKFEQREAPQGYPENDHIEDDESILPGPPPSFRIRGERLSRNVADAMSVIWDKFWSEDVRQIIRIIKNRFGQLMPYVRRFLAHVVAFWGGITYIRRAITAFIRLLKRDERVRELLERLGWACATTMRVFLSMCAMLMQATLQFYHLLRDRIIPDTRRVIPIIYYKMIVRLLNVAKYSPWSLVVGPFSLTFGIDSSKVPSQYYLHDRLWVDREDVTFASMSDVVQSIRESVYYHRSRAANHYDATQSQHHHEREVDEDDEEYSSDHGEEHDEHRHCTHPVEESESEHVREYEHGHEDHEDENEYREDKEITIASTSTPVHTNSTNEMAVAPPTDYSGPMYHPSKQGLSNRRLSNGPLSERTNIDGDH